MCYPLSNRDLILSLVAVLCLGLLACEERDQAPTAPAATQDPLINDATLRATDPSMGTMAIALPVNQSIATTAPNPAFRITQTGTGPNGGFIINRSTNSQPALTASTNGTGGAGVFRINRTASPANALLAQTNGARAAFRALSTGTSHAGLFEITNSTNTSPVIYAQTGGQGSAGLFQVNNSGNAEPGLTVEHIGTGPAITASASRGNGIVAVTSGGGSAGVFRLNSAAGGIGPAVDVLSTDVTQEAGNFRISNTSNPNSAIRSVTNGTGAGGVFVAEGSQSQGTGLVSIAQGTGWAGDFRAVNNGVRISAGSTGLVVANGTKNAVVPTTSGERLLYTEESSEVWFTDYGFGNLENGRARILIDPDFAQTVSLDEPYHVFIQPYGDAELYVKERTNLGFVVIGRDGDPNAEFGYRVVAKRLGFEKTRLERAPWADNSPGF